MGDPREGARPPTPSPYFKTKPRPEGPKEFFGDTGPPRLSKGLDDRPPLSQGVIRCRIRDNTADIEHPSLLPIIHYVEIPQGYHPLAPPPPTPPPVKCPF